MALFLENYLFSVVFQDYLKNDRLEGHLMSDYVISAITNSDESNVELLVSKWYLITVQLYLPGSVLKAQSQLRDRACVYGRFGSCADREEHMLTINFCITIFHPVRTRSYMVRAVQCTR